MGIFWKLGDSPSDIRSRFGMMYMCTMQQPYNMMVVLIERLCSELKVFDRELLDDLYSPSAYLVAHLLASSPMLIIQPLLFATCISAGCNIRGGASHVLLFVAVHIMMAFVINGLSWTCAGLHRAFSVASLIGNTSFSFIGLGSGFLVNLHDLPIYVRWVQYLSFASYAYRIFMSNEFSDRTFPGCPYADRASCQLYDGNSILHSQNIGVHDYSVPSVALLSLGAVYYIVTVILLYVMRFPPTGVVGDKGDRDDEYETTTESHKDLYTALDIDTSARNPKKHELITIKVTDICLDVFTSSPFYVPNFHGSTAQRTKKTLLLNISATVRPGRLVALMGGSGSGVWLYFLGMGE